VQERAQQANRVQKVLEGATSKLAAVATDVLGKSARELLELLLAGEQDVAAIAEHARTRMRPKMAELKRALQGHVQPQHRFLLRSLLAHLDCLDAASEEAHAEIERQLAPYQDAVRLLQTIPGVQEVAAATIVAAIGVDMARFPSACAAHTSGFLGRAVSRQPAERGQANERGHHQGQSLAARRAGGGEVVWSIAHTRDNYLVAQ
jgi:transposase